MLRRLVINDVNGKSIKVIVDNGTLLCELKENINLPKFPFKSLNHLQSVFYETYITKGLKENALIVAPTSSGKTGVAILFMNGKGTYAVPTKALANELYEKFVKFFGEDKVGLRTGDVFEEFITDRDIYICTYESLANSLRTNRNWITLPIVLDEIHHIYKDRGVVIEEILAYINYNKLFPFMSLSATVPKPQELAELIGANYVLISNYRPVPVEKTYKRLNISDEDELVGFIVERVLKLSDDEKTLVFVHKKDVGYKVLEELSSKGLGILNETLPFIPQRNGEDVAFHNADIPPEERERIENSFRNGDLRTIIATQTLAYGVNLPADRVIIFARRIKWNKYIPDVLDILQMEGRAGRYGIKDKGYVELYVWSKSNRDIQEELEDIFESIKPYVSSMGGSLNLEEYWGISSFVALMVLGAVKVAGNNWKKFVSLVPSLKNVEGEFLEDVYAYLERSGFISKGKLTNIGKILLQHSISPLGYIEMKRRWESGIDTLLTIRPLIYMKKITGSLQSFLKDKFYEERMAFKTKYNFYDFPEDGTDELWAYLNGRLFHYPNISNPPGELGFSLVDIYHLARAIIALRKKGYILITDEDILRVMHSYRYGLPMEYAPLGGMKGIGFIRANALQKALYLMGIERVEFGEFQVPEDLYIYLKYVLFERYGNGDKANRETEIIRKLLKKDRVLGDERILKAFVLLKLGNKGLKHLKKNKSEILRLLKLWNP